MMKKRKKLSHIMLMTIFFMGWNMLAHAAELTVQLVNPPPGGMVSFLLFDSANSFGDLRDPVKVVRLPLDGRDVYHIEEIKSGEYALLVYYDENNNGKLDKNFIGIPREPLGFSNRYQPKGPPRYSRAAFFIEEGNTLHFDVKLYRPLGKPGQLGVGLGVIARSSPYRDYNAPVYQVIPAITYIGERLQIYGPKIQFGLAGSGKLRLAATGKYRIGVYEEDESDFLKGMGDRRNTFMAGLAIKAEVPGGIDLSAIYEHDILDEIGGGTARLELKKSYQSGVFRYSPEISLNWLSSELSNHDFGVPADNATEERPAYDTGSTLSAEGGLGVFVEITEDLLIIVNTGVELMGDKVKDSPIVSEDYVIKGFATVAFIF
jgi:outer membrane protein